MNWRKLLALDVVLIVLWMVVVYTGNKVHGAPSFPNFVTERADGTISHNNFYVDSIICASLCSFLVFGIAGLGLALKNAWKAITSSTGAS
jgi:hypothetical protein